MRKIKLPDTTVNIRESIFQNSARDPAAIDETGSARPLPAGFSFDTKALRDLLAARENGFAVVWLNSETIVFAVDRIRTYPLFYALAHGALFISDDASWIKARIGDCPLNAQAVLEFCQSGFVSGNKTLYGNIFTLQAGEFAGAKKKNGTWQVTRERYFNYLPQTCTNRPIEDLLNELDGIFHCTFTRLIESCHGKTMVVPLSGGLDSRLIVSWLKRLQCTNVLCYSFGTPANRDCIRAKQIAAQLGYPWRFVHLTRKLWKTAYASRDNQRLKKNYSGYCSALSNQEFPALYYLLNQTDWIPENSVFIPGHTGDFISGGHIPLGLYQYSADKDAAVDYILEKHFMLWKTLRSASRSEDLRYIRERIAEQLEPVVIDSHERLAHAIEWYDWQERQAKFIVQFNSVYKFFNFHFELPLWSNNLMDFFLALPMNQKLGKQLYAAYLKKYDRLGLFQDLTLPEANQAGSHAAVCQGRPPHYMRSLARRGKRWADKYFLSYFHNDLNYYAPFSYLRVVAGFAQYRNPNSFYVQDYLREVSSGKL